MLVCELNSSMGMNGKKHIYIWFQSSTVSNTQRRRTNIL